MVEFDHDENISHTIDLEDFAAKIETKIWDRLAKLSWRSYDEAVKFCAWAKAEEPSGVASILSR